MTAITELLKTCSVKTSDWSADKVQTLYKTLTQTSFAADFRNFSQSPAFKELPLGQQLRGHALYALYQADRYWVKTDPLFIIKEALQMGSEQMTLQMLVDPKIRRETFLRWMPKILKPDQTLDCTAFLRSPLPELYDSTDPMERLIQAEVKTTGVYKPSRAVINARNGRVCFLEPKTGVVFWLNKGKEILMTHLGGEHLIPVKLSEEHIRALAMETPDNLVAALTTPDYHLVRYGSALIHPEEQIIHERFYSIIAQYVSEVADIYAPDLLPRPGYHPVWLARYAYPGFGMDHLYGSRRPYIDDVEYSDELSTYSQTRYPQPGGRMRNVSTDELCRIGVPALIGAHGNSLMADLLVAADGTLYLTGAKHSLPYIKGTGAYPSMIADWMVFPQGLEQISDAWREVLSKLDANELIRKIEDECKRLQEAIPEEPIRLLPNLQYVLHTTVYLLNKCVEKPVSLAALLNFMENDYIRDRQGQPITEGGTPRNLPGQLWLAMDLAAHDVEYDLTGGKMLPPELLKKVHSYLDKALDYLWKPEKDRDQK